MSATWYVEKFFNDSPVAPFADVALTGTLVDLADSARRAEKISLGRVWAYFDASLSFAMTAITSTIRFVRDVVITMLLAPTWVFSDAGRKLCKAHGLRAVIDLAGVLLSVAGTFYPPVVTTIVHFVLGKADKHTQDELHDRAKMVYWEATYRLNFLNKVSDTVLS